MSLPAGEHRYWGSPVGYDGCIYTLLVDFAEGKIEVSRFDCGRYGWDRLAEIALDSIEDCYNLMLKLSPPTLVRHSSDDVFETIWPERARFRVGGNEGLCARQGTRLYFSAWYEDPDYHEETLVRDLATGEVLERRPGAPWLMPDGRLWLLTNT